LNPILELTKLSKSFPGHQAVRDISLSIDKGELFCLLGPSGCGKTTTLRMIAGFETPSSGEVRLGGERIEHLAPYERNVSTVFQNYALFPHLTVRKNVEFGLKRKGAANIEAKVNDVLKMVRLDSKADRLPSEISGGEKQRAALARSLVLEPDVLLLDEPLSALDPQLRKQVRLELKALQRRVGVTFLMITHDQEEALSLADRIAVMNRGVIEQTGTPQEIYLTPRTRFVASFLGAMNWVGDVGVRPESTRLAKQEVNGGSRCHAAVVRGATFLGNCVHVEAQLASGEAVIAEVPRHENGFGPGEQVHVWWHPHDEVALPEYK
jgi:ABC-type Fe3+/spermidine/putrescine transport system ATPase subunit